MKICEKCKSAVMFCGDCSNSLEVDNGDELPYTKRMIIDEKFDVLEKEFVVNVITYLAKGGIDGWFISRV